MLQSPNCLSTMTKKNQKQACLITHQDDSSFKMELTSKGQGKTIDKRRRIWSTMEEEVLIAALKDMITKGWKCENGFKTGYLKLLERAMLKAFPSTDIRAEPHINSKIHVWKKFHGSLAAMFGVSGISWNESTKTIDAQDDAWDSYVKEDNNARTMRYRHWPHYPDWCEIFGKDKFTRGNAQDFTVTVAVQEMETNKRKEKEPVAQLGKEREPAAEIGCVFEGLDDVNEISVCQPQSDDVLRKKQTRKKRKMSECSSDPFVAAINVFCDKLDARFEDIARRIGYEYDVSSARREVYAALGTIPGLQVRDKLTVAKFLVNRNGDLDLFFSLPEKDRAEMVYMILGGDW